MAWLGNAVPAKRKEGSLFTKRSIETENIHLELDIESVRTGGHEYNKRLGKGDCVNM